MCLAIAKIEQGTYGICEATGDVIPLEQMSILPTARTADDFYIISNTRKKHSLLILTNQMILILKPSTCREVLSVN